MKVEVTYIADGKRKRMSKVYADILIKLKKVRVDGDATATFTASSVDVFAATMEAPVLTKAPSIIEKISQENMSPAIENIERAIDTSKHKKRENNSKLKTDLPED